MLDVTVSVMRRRHTQRVLVHLDAHGVGPLPMPEIRAILRGAEELIASGGRTLLCKILKGSRDKDVLAHGLEKNPSWAFYRKLGTDDITARIDWMILNGYLRLEYFHRLDVLQRLGVLSRILLHLVFGYDSLDLVHPIPERMSIRTAF